MTNINIERLKTLRSHLASLPAKRRAGKLKRKFDLSHWAIRLGRKDAKRRGCGTTACALGEAGLIPEFRAAGLVTNFSHFNGSVEFNGSDSFRAAEEFFNLPRSLAYFLFDPADYPLKGRKEVHVIARIDTVIGLANRGLLNVAR